MVLRKGNAGLYYRPISQHSDKDQFEGEKVDYNSVVDWSFFYEENTIKVYPMLKQKSTKREWSTGKNSDKPLETNLQSWLEDFINRSVSPHLIYYYPYNLDTQENIGKPLTEKQLTQRKNKKLKIIPPRQVCDVAVVQGWDLAILAKISQKAQIGFTGPSISEADRFVLNQTVGKIQYYVANTPYITFEKVLIITLEKELDFSTKETLEFFKASTQTTKVLTFLPTYYEAEIAEKHISGKVPTMYYDGAQKISNAPIKGTSIEFNLCISCIHGPLGQGLDLGQFKLAVVSTNCSRPKCLFTGKPATKTIQKYILDDIADKCQQAALRILRLLPEEKVNSPRAILFYGKNALDIGNRVKNELSQVGHVAKLINAHNSTKYAQEYLINWIAQKSTSHLDNIGACVFEEQEAIVKTKQEIQKYLIKNPNTDWRQLQRNIWSLKNTSEEHKTKIKEWFIKTQTLENKQLQKLIEKIKDYLKKYPNVNWTKIYKRFHIDRKTSIEKDVVRKALNL